MDNLKKMPPDGSNQQPKLIRLPRQQQSARPFILQTKVVAPAQAVRPTASQPRPLGKAPDAAASAPPLHVNMNRMPNACRTPTAPPVYRPQPTPVVLQRKAAV